MLYGTELIKHKIKEVGIEEKTLKIGCEGLKGYWIRVIIYEVFRI